MPGLIRGVARTAVIAGTATAVSNNVSRRQAGRWAAQEQQAAMMQQAAADQAVAQYQAAQQAAAAPVPSSAPADPTIEKLQQLAALHAQGVLSAEEFAAAKAKVLGL